MGRKLRPLRRHDRRSRRCRITKCTGIAVLGAVTLALAYQPARVVAQQASRIAPDVYSRLQWRHIGPEGNRISAVTGVVGQPLVYYAGSASGGIHKTTDGGVTWDPIFDGQPVHSIGDIAVAPSDPSTVWAGTGEACIRSHISVGEGIYKSTDAGRTWARMGLEQTGRIGKVIVHPKNPDVVLACALGHAYGPQPERGVYRTTDGGRNWERVLFVDENTGCSELDMDPTNPRKLFAGMWQLDIKTWARESGGPGSGLFTSNDGGSTWTRLRGQGLPTREVGKVKVAIAPSNPDRVYAMIETGDGIPWKGKETDRGQVWRSEDGGRNWRVVSYDRNAMGRAHYYSHIFVSPDNENETYFLTANYSMSLDGGQTLATQNDVRGARRRSSRHVDRSDRRQPDDRRPRPGVFDLAEPRQDLAPQSTAERADVSRHGRQPDSVLRATATSRTGRRTEGRATAGCGGFGGGGGIPRSLWHTVAGGESGWTTPDPVDPNLIWSSASGSGSVGGIVAIYEENRRQARNVEVWPEQANGIPADLRYRFNWTMPLTMSPHDRNIVYVGSQHVHRTSNRGQSWEVISPDLSTNDKTRQQFSGGLTGDNIGVEYAFTVMAIAESRLERGLIWAGTNDGQVQVTRDNGKSWTNVTKNIPNLPPWGTVGNIEPSRYDAGTAYLTVDLHQVNNRDPFVYKTTDYGRTWRAITNGIPRSMLSYAHCIREDPVRRGLLYLGTENAHLRVVRRRRELAVAADQHAPRTGVLDRGAGALQRSRHRDLWPRLLDSRRPVAAAAAHAAGVERRRAPVRAARGLSLPRHHAGSLGGQRSDGRTEPAVRRGDQLLPAHAAGGRCHGVDPRRTEPGDSHAERAEGRRPQSHVTGICATSRRRKSACAPARSTPPTSRSVPTARGPAAGHACRSSCRPAATPSG